MAGLLKQANAATNAAVIMLGLGHLLTYVLLRDFQLRSYRLYMIALVLTHVLRLSHTVDAPQLRPFNAQALLTWMQRILGTSDAHYLTVGFAFMGHRPLVPIMAGPFLLASLRLASFLKQQMPAVQHYVDPLLSKKEQVFEVMAYADVTALPVLTVLSFMKRTFLTPLVYTFMLKQRYNSPTGAKYHQPVWKRFDNAVQPYLAKLPPRAVQLVTMIQRWFTTPQ